MLHQATPRWTRPPRPDHAGPGGPSRTRLEQDNIRLDQAGPRQSRLDQAKPRRTRPDHARPGRRPDRARQGQFHNATSQSNLQLTKPSNKTTNSNHRTKQHNKTTKQNNQIKPSNKTTSSNDRTKQANKTFILKCKRTKLPNKPNMTKTRPRTKNNHVSKRTI